LIKKKDNNEKLEIREEIINRKAKEKIKLTWQVYF
jgi:hypothetical protein